MREGTPLEEPGTDEAVERIEAQLIVLARAMEATHRRRGYPLERAPYLMLRRLVERPMSIGDLARELALEHSTVTRQIESMRKKGLVDRRSDPRDGRIVVIQPTEEGTRLCASMKETRRERVAALLNAWTDTDRDALADLLTRLNEDLARILADPVPPPRPDVSAPRRPE